MENKTIGILLATAIAVLVGVILINIVSESTVTKTNQIYVTDTINISGARIDSNDINESYFFHLTKGCPMKAGGWRTDYHTACALTAGLVTNGSSAGGVFEGTTDYILYTDNDECTGNVTGGDLSLVNSSHMYFSNPNITYVTYGYCSDEYLGGFSGTMLDLVPGFFAIALLVGSAFIFFWIMKNEGIEI